MLRERLSGCPFDRKNKSPCDYKGCFDNPDGEDCINNIKKFCKKTDISERNKLGCNIYYAVKTTDEQHFLPPMFPLSEPSTDYKDLAMLIPQFVEIDVLDKIIIMKDINKKIKKKEQDGGGKDDIYDIETKEPKLNEESLIK